MSLYSLENTVLYGKGDSDKHLLTMYGIGIGMGAKRILELGVRGGSTTLPLLMVAQKTGGSVISVDIEQTDFVPPISLEGTSWKFVKQDAVEFLRSQVPTEPYDIIYIDDWHAYDHVKNELTEIDRLVSPKTIVLVHDLMYGNTCPHYHSDITMKEGQWANGGPYRAVAELPSQFWEFSTLPFNNGLTILRKKYSNRYFQ